MAGLQERWSESELLTLRLGAVWILSALVGQTRFDADEQEAFWDCVTDAALRTDGLSRQVLEATAANRRWLFDEFELDDRPIVSGLNTVVRLLERVDHVEADRVRSTLMAVGRGFARARGPFGRRLTVEDERILKLLEQLLQPEADLVRDSPMNSDEPI